MHPAARLAQRHAGKAKMAHGKGTRKNEKSKGNLIFEEVPPRMFN
jgi:hypothetical protein